MFVQKKIQLLSVLKARGKENKFHYGGVHSGTSKGFPVPQSLSLIWQIVFRWLLKQTKMKR